MKEYCVDLEIAKELEENGFPLKCKYVWCEYYNGDILQWDLYEFDLDDPVNKQIWSPTSDEILEELPLKIQIKSEEYYLQIFRDSYSNKKMQDKEYFCVSYVTYNNKCFHRHDNVCIEEDKLSNGLALMWLYLKKEGYIK